LNVVERRVRTLHFMFAVVAAVHNRICGDGTGRSIIVASTTSTQELDRFACILPIFKAKTGINVKVIAQGTGQALDTARLGDADVAFVRAHAQEEGFRLPVRSRESRIAQLLL
jgi:tungstate transport system substrate-binding protein